MAVQETISIEQYPDINWSRPVRVHDDGYSEFSFGLTRIRVRGQLLQLGQDGILAPYDAPESTRSSLYFGVANMRPSVCAYAQYEYPFSLEHPDRINEVGKLTIDFFAGFQQMVTARRILTVSNQLLDNLRFISVDNPELLKQVGVLEQVLKKQTFQVLPQESIKKAMRLKELSVEVFGEAGYNHGLWTPDWVIENFLAPK